MCDTFVLFPKKNTLNTTILAKNSDRPAFDCQPLILNEAKNFRKSEYVQLEYIKIPQVEHTFTTMGCSPYWCYGYEMGVNEFNVAIGNEAIFTKECRNLIENKCNELGILGMDLIRIALERGKSAFEAVNVMTKLIEEYGQLRDHYEDTFLEGPKFNAAYPDFHTICMHESPANFTWGITASSSIIILPQNNTSPIFLWAPTTPCTSIYTAFFLDCCKLPESVSKTGNIPKSVISPICCQIDSFNEKSYWWQFRELLDLAKKDRTGSGFNITKPIIRAMFDPLEDEIIDEVNKYIKGGFTTSELTDFHIYEVKEVEKRLQILKKIINNINEL